MYFWIIIFQNKVIIKKGYVQKKVFEEAEHIMGGSWWWCNVVYVSKIAGKSMTDNQTLKKEPGGFELNKLVTKSVLSVPVSAFELEKIKGASAINISICINSEHRIW